LTLLSTACHIDRTDHKPPSEGMTTLSWQTANRLSQAQTQTWCRANVNSFHEWHGLEEGITVQVSAICIALLHSNALYSVCQQLNTTKWGCNVSPL